MKASSMVKPGTALGPREMSSTKEFPRLQMAKIEISLNILGLSRFERSKISASIPSSLTPNTLRSSLLGLSSRASLSPSSPAGAPSFASSAPCSSAPSGPWALSLK
eukprot:CAMPEP_0184327642 /NCGR_PEP_ID=MMETSP1049-20130417/143200_1 /TAXON_ID=77928 /ORGANISM="Proteomonas sulcata, Strain CCMP704" /LENGTH=105 /DNA_ID=CAMNT_0026649905 /DNA_START=1161 /DNA_END=1475 /DNA_ORIENTATION=+